MSSELLPGENDLKMLIEGRHNSPHSLLGMHIDPNLNCIIIRCFDPKAVEVFAITETGEKVRLEKIQEPGFFAVAFPKAQKHFKYDLEKHFDNGSVFTSADPYCFLPGIGEMDQYLFNKGEHQKVYEFMGAHLRDFGGVKGVLFTVWAPSAERVSVVGNFNQWDGRRHQMRMIGSSGIWELFIPGLKEGEIYKFEIRAKNGDIFLKLDPYAYWTEMRPNTAAKVYSMSKYQWTDDAWMTMRKTKNWLEGPMNIYEVHLGSWRGPGLRDLNPADENDFHNYKDIAHALAEYALEMNYTHLQLLPVAEHPFDQSWGYQITGYYAPTARFGTPDEFAYFVNYMHSKGIGVLVDWVPAHFPKDDFSLGRFDGTALYEHLDPRQGEHRDWGTFIFNYGRCEVRNFLIGNALYWFERYHIDGLRVDAVASMLYLDYSKQDGNWVPNKYGGKENIDAISFMRRLNELTHELYPGTLMIAEESTSWTGVSRPAYLGGLGFTCKWNMGWMHDTLEYFSKDPVFRSYHHDKLTFSIWYAFSENFILPFSHDEVVHGKRSLLDKMSGDYWQKFANLRLLMSYMVTHPGKKLLFMGCEFGQWNEWDCKNTLDWQLLKYPIHSGLRNSMKDLNKLYRQRPALWELDFQPKGFEWVDINDILQSVLSYIRWDKNHTEPILVVLNNTPVVRNNYRVGVPFAGTWHEIFNSDAEAYGGSGVGNKGRVDTEPRECHGRPCSLSLTLPPLGAILFSMRKND
ncbi:MAG TPA: 1,4-alpha-glucan branching enzyme [Lentisphaeria bacterium]|nr:MAG: 1,4-alpha-glucan branching enzyme [Lentisphaerae bacterium GWF2_49_21]HBC87794.1 1,4-alpha-glucan branching enzyme [Lentisphaeria bacterium]